LGLEADYLRALTELERFNIIGLLMLSNPLEALKRLWSVSYDELEGDEDVVIDTAAALFWWVFAKQGRVLLTTKRIVFLPMRFRAWPQWFSAWPRRDIFLTDIAKISEGPLWRRVIGPYPDSPSA